MLQVGVGADGSQEFHLLFDILTCKLSRRYCVIGRGGVSGGLLRGGEKKNTLRAESPSYYRE